MFRSLAAASCALLIALGAGPALAQSAPPGSYQQSCQRIRVHGDRLSAVCTSPRGRHVRSSTRVFCRGDIANVNGHLRCLRGRR